MERKCFTFLKSYFEAAQALPSKEDQADFYNAVCMYALTGEEPEVSGVVRALFLLAKPNIDASIKKAEAGAKGGSRSKGSENKGEANASKPEANASKPEANEKQTESNAEAEPKNAEAIKDKGDRIKDKGDRSNDKGVKEKSKKESADDPFASEFEEFWDVYPRHVAKDKARAAFIKVIRECKVDISTLVDAVLRQKHSQQWTKDGGQFIPHPTTWLNQHRWMDEEPTSCPVSVFTDVCEEAF